jgi:hypothetical protein
VASIVTAILAAGCVRDDDAPATMGRTMERTAVTIVVDHERVEVARLTRAVTALCQAGQEAATDPNAAKATYDRRSHEGVDTTVRVLRRSYSLLASSMTEVALRVQTAMDAEGADNPLPHDLARLTELMREGAAKLGVTTAACRS